MSTGYAQVNGMTKLYTCNPSLQNKNGDLAQISCILGSLGEKITIV